MNIYLAGPMRGIPEFNFPAFAAAARALREEGHSVFSPAEKDNERHAVDISKGNATGDEAIASAQHGFNLREALGIDLDYICQEADAIALLPGWEQSTGANAERATAIALGLKVIELPGKRPTRALPSAYIESIDNALAMVKHELIRARQKFGRFHGPHEGFAVLKEEVDELWDDVKSNRRDAAFVEAIQVAAMATSFLVDLYPAKLETAWETTECTREGMCSVDHSPCNGVARHDP